ncbi:hypothetical protein Lal_00028585 [Lupinus albus]|nr:hypothetical protein Lal_00028585 [Lupinus albus]
MALSVSNVVFVIIILLISSYKLCAVEHVLSYEMVNVVNEFPHDPQAFTEGLLYGGNDTLFESTGDYGKSSVRKVDLHTGKVEELEKMDDSLFGEGLTLVGKRCLGTFNHEMNDGWGLATDGKVLFGSDGSSTLYQLDPQTFKAVSKQVVYYKGKEVFNLNELEYINGEIWANVFQSDCIARISPKDGFLGWILLQNLRKELLKAGNTGIDVLNGIAWDSEQNRIFVTGKLWPKLYEVKVFPIKEPIEESVIEKLCLLSMIFSSSFVIISLFFIFSNNNCFAFQLHDVSYHMVNIVNQFPHDPQAYTEGLLYGGNDTLFESTGLFGESSVRKVDLQTGMVEELQKMDDSLFGEGLTLLGERLVSVMLTGPAYDQWPMENLTVFQLKLWTFNHDMKEGWGLATDGKVLFGSDGSSTLYQMDPQTFKAVSKQVVCYKGHQVQLLNELEYVNGEIWANVYMTDCIVRISPNDGGVLGWILLQNLREELLEEGNIGIEVLNGIAWDGEQKRIFVTGKLWPKLYEVNVFPTKEPIEEGVIEQLCLPIIF